MKLATRYPSLTLALITIIVYSPTFFNDFQLSWDDQWQLLNYKYVTEHSFNDLYYHFTHFHLNQYMPVNTLLYIIIYELFGFNASAFHATSLILHIINVLLVYYILKKIIEEIKPEWNPIRKLYFSTFVTFIFAIHPLQVESIAWISASKVISYSFFFLLGWAFYIKYCKEEKIRYFFVVILSYFLSFGSKEQAIIYPFSLLVFDLIFKRFQDINLSFSILKKKVILEKIPVFIIFLFFSWFTISNNSDIFRLESFPIYQRLVFSSASLMDYIYRFIFPHKLQYIYFFPIEIGEMLPIIYWGYPLLIVMIILSIWRFSKKNKIIFFGALLFFTNIILVIHIIPIPRQMFTADRYIYISMIGLGLMLFDFLNSLYTKYSAYRKFILSGIALWSIYLCCYSFSRTIEWKNSDSIKRNLIEIIE